VENTQAEQRRQFNIQEEGGLTPQMLSIVSGSVEIVKLLREKGAH
jgi:ankyrin repeat protein